MKLKNLFSISITIFIYFFTAFTNSKIIYLNKTQFPSQNKFETLIQDSIKIFFNININQKNIFSILNNLQKLSNIDIVTYLENNKNKKLALEKFITQSENVLLAADLYIVELENKINLLKSNKENCKNNLYINNQEILSSITDENIKYFNLQIQEKTKNAVCEAKINAELFVYNNLLSQYKYYYQILQNKINYLQLNEQYIVKFFDVIKDDLASKLQEITWNLKYKQSYILPLNF